MYTIGRIPLLLGLFSILLFVSATNTEFLRVCYFPSWAWDRGSKPHKYDVGNIDTSLCTHLIYAFGSYDSTLNELKANVSQLRSFNNLKMNNSDLKTLLSLGGEKEGDTTFLAITNSNETLANFTNRTVKDLRAWKFDGLDIDWEFPNAETRENLTELLQSLREAFDAESPEPDRRLLLTLAGAPGKQNIDPGYNIPAVAQYVDFVSLMTYDYTSKGADVAAFNSPLYSRPDPKFDRTLSTNWTVHYWHEGGLPLNKTVVGITGVGRRLVLENSSLTEPGSSVTGDVRKGKTYQIEAGLAYPEICQLLENSTDVREFDKDQKNPYLVQGDNWVGYEDLQSLDIKVDWMLDLGVRGLMFWSLDQDDFSGQFCNNGTYPLLSLVKAKTSVDVDTTTTSSPSTTPAETTTTTTTTTTTERPKKLATRRPTPTTLAPNGSGQTQNSNLQLFLFLSMLVFYFALN